MRNRKKYLEESSKPVRFFNWVLKGLFDVRFRSPAFRLRIQYCPVSDHASVWGPDGYNLGACMKRVHAEQYVRRVNAYEPLVDALSLISKTMRDGKEIPFTADEIQHLVNRLETAPIPEVK